MATGLVIALKLASSETSFVGRLWLLLSCLPEAIEYMGGSKQLNSRLSYEKESSAPPWLSLECPGGFCFAACCCTL